MDSARQIESVVKLGDKRAAEDAGGPVAKKVKRGGVLGNVNKVAEMVLVLAAMGKMRGGRVPSQVEKSIMSTAREKLAEVCQSFAPKDVFPRDVFGGIIEDLGLNKVREQRLGFRPPKISIAEKMLLSKRKMEKAEDFSLPSATNSSQRSHGNSGAAVENRGPAHAVRVFPSDKPSHMPISSRGFPPTAVGHVAGTNSTCLPYQLPTSEVRPVISGGLPSNHLGRESSSVALPRIDRPQFRLDGRSNGSSHTSQIQANSSADHASVKTPTWSVQPQAVPSAKIGSDTKVPMQTSIKVDGAADAKLGIPPQSSASKPFIRQTTSGNSPSVHQHLQGTNTTQAPTLRNTHAEICKIVQKLLHPQASERPPWTPPSRDYMSKALTCQVCKSTTNDVDTVLVCDACEKGFHMKCLQINNPKGVPRSEWHCGKCLQLSDGKPLPPKYGRVMRNINATKVPSNNASVQSSSDKKVGSLDEKVSQQKITANGNTSLQSTPSSSEVNNSSLPTTASKMENLSEMRGNAIAGLGKMEDKVSSGTSNNITAISSVAIATGPSVKRSFEDNVLESKPHPSSKSEIVQNSSGCLQPPSNPEDNHQSWLLNNAVPSMQSFDSHIMDKHMKESCDGGGLCNNLTGKSSQDDRETVRTNPGETSTACAGYTEHHRSLPDHVHNVDWISDILRIDGENTFYHSCCINGVVYKLQDHVLIRVANDKLIPSKLQAMWEDSKMKTKWVTVNRCYFPGDLPQAVGRPCGLESSEVYESTIGCNIMAGLIQGPCEVLPPSRFAEEKERRTSSGMGPKHSLRPLYLCKWIYDESKGLFRDVTC